MAFSASLLGELKKLPSSALAATALALLKSSAATFVSSCAFLTACLPSEVLRSSRCFASIAAFLDSSDLARKVSRAFSAVFMSSLRNLSSCCLISVLRSCSTFSASSASFLTDRTALADCDSSSSAVFLAFSALLFSSRKFFSSASFAVLSLPLAALYASSAFLRLSSTLCSLAVRPCSVFSALSLAASAVARAFFVASRFSMLSLASRAARSPSFFGGLRASFLATGLPGFDGEAGATGADGAAGAASVGGGAGLPCALAFASSILAFLAAKSSAFFFSSAARLAS
mmetsp:Transcript_55691/g.125573  ORF Transcript_55691/g.125573 Transcript_55691/m.125573 type:complete len:287 (+) Transcript_55691:300-1160(+)